MARPWSFPVPRLHRRGIRTPSSFFSAPRPRSRPRSTAHPQLKAVSRVIHTDVAVKMDDKPSQALRQGRWKSSMWLAIDAVKKGEADVAVSAGNTGALMAMAKIHLRTMAGIDRPAIAAIWPTLRGESVVLDLGATIGADAQHLIDLAVMGAAMARILLDIDRPTVGLLNIGVEEVKGLEEVREAGRILRERDLPHIQLSRLRRGRRHRQGHGRRGGDRRLCRQYRAQDAPRAPRGRSPAISSAAMKPTVWTRIGYLFARGAFASSRPKDRSAPRNGGVFLGLNGIVIKSHGGADANGFSAAIDIGYEMVRNDLMAKIEQALVPEKRAWRADLPKRRDTGGRSGIVTLRSVIVGAGCYLPERVLTNAELASRSTPPTTGSCSAPASANATSPPTANSPPISASRRRRRRSPMPA